MKILLVKPNPSPRSINLQSFMICEPLELEYCASLLSSMGHESDIADLIIDKSFPRAFRVEKYDAVAFTAYQVHIGIVKKYAAYVKKKCPEVVTLVGGVQAEVVPQSFDDPNIDVVLTGGLTSLSAVIKGMEEGAPVSRLKELGKTPARAKFDFPFPDRSKTLRYRKHYNYIYHDECATVKTSFSCAYDCDFCFCTRVAKYAERDLDEVVEELAQIREKNVFIVDDNFLYRRERVLRFCDLLQQKGIKKTYIAFGRADFIAANEDVIARLAECGFDAFFVGLESYKQGELSDYNKRTTVETNNRAVRILEKYGMQCYSGLIVGYDWDKKDFDNLIGYINGFEHPMVNIQPITPIKGTPYYEKVKHLITEDETHYELFDMAHVVMKPQKMSVRAFYWNILRAYLKTSASRAGRKYIKERYGMRVYRRVRRGAYKIVGQYLRLIAWPNGKRG